MALSFKFKFARISWRDAWATLIPVALLVVLALWITLKFVQPAPPDTIIIASGPEGSSFASFAQRYQKILARQGVKLRIVPSEGSLDNLKRLADPKHAVDIGFVAGGLAGQVEGSAELDSLGSIFYAPVYVFYRAPKPLQRLSALEGRRIALGREGSGTHVLAAALLRANGVDEKNSKFVELDGKAAADALLKKEVDAAFLAGDSAAFATIRDLIRTDGIRLFDFNQGEAYVKRFRYLTRLDLPPGTLDLGKNLPPETLTLLAPTVELVARESLHPALSDMLIEAAREVHGRSTLFQKAGEFPAPLEHEYRISDDAQRYYKSGKTFAYRHFPFWVASLIDRIVVVVVPLMVILIPAFNIVPRLYRWRVIQRVYRRYAELMALERAAFNDPDRKERAELLRRLDKLEEAVIKLRLPGSFADQVYLLRNHIGFVRARLSQASAQ